MLRWFRDVRIVHRPKWKRAETSLNLPAALLAFPTVRFKTKIVIRPSPPRPPASWNRTSCFSEKACPKIFTDPWLRIRRKWTCSFASVRRSKFTLWRPYQVYCLIITCNSKNWYLSKFLTCSEKNVMKFIFSCRFYWTRGASNSYQ